MIRPVNPIIAIKVLKDFSDSTPASPLIFLSRWWRDAVLIPHFESLAVTVRGMLPPEIAEHLTYEGVAATLRKPSRAAPPTPSS